MNDFTQVVKDALEYYDENALKNYDLIRTFKYYTIIADVGKIAFYDDNKKKIYEYNYEVIGKYIPPQKLWMWGWSSGELNKELITISRKVLNYALDLDKENFFLKTALITSRHQITYRTQIDIHIALTSFLSKRPFVYKLNSPTIDYYEDYEPENDDETNSTPSETGIKRGVVERTSDGKKSKLSNHREGDTNYLNKISHTKNPIGSYYIILTNK
jgi:hypothetical protein